MEISRKDILEILQVIEEARAPGLDPLKWERGSRVIPKILKYLAGDEAPAASSLLANLVNHITVTHPIEDKQIQLSLSRPFQDAVTFLENAAPAKRDGSLKDSAFAVNAVEKDGGVFFGSWASLEELKENLVTEHMKHKGCERGCLKERRISMRKSYCNEPTTQSGDRAKCNKCKETFYVGSGVRPCVSAQYVLDQALGMETENEVAKVS